MQVALKDRVNDLYIEAFGRKPEITVFSPGRINLIGEHTDYNKGFVLPTAIDRGIYFAIGKNVESSIIIAHDINDSITFSIDTTEPSQKEWANYLMGVINKIRNDNHIGQFSAVFMGNLPVGAGLSSSAALSCGLAYSLSKLFDLTYTKLALAKIAQWAEHEFVFVKCGLMDQLANLYGIKNHFLQIDMKDYSIKNIRWRLNEYSLVLFDSGIRHKLASSKYNERRLQCGNIVDALRKLDPEITSLRDASKENLQQIRNLVNYDDFRKAKYVVEENLRVLATIESIEHDDIETIGTLMNETHRGLSEEFEVSCEEVDFIQVQTIKHQACAGGRIMGAGFGGCTLNLIESSKVDEIYTIVKAQYLQLYGKVLKIYKIVISNGTQIIQ